MTGYNVNTLPAVTILILLAHELRHTFEAILPTVLAALAMITTAVNAGACYEAQKGRLIASERRYSWSRRRLEEYWDAVADEEKV
jgi:hypothetical protein